MRKKKQCERKINEEEKTQKGRKKQLKRNKITNKHKKLFLIQFLILRPYTLEFSGIKWDKYV